MAIMVHAFQLLFIDCNYPRAFVWWIGMHAVMFFFLFKDFYNQTYSRKRKNDILKASQNGVIKNGYVNHVDVKSAKNGFHQNGNISQNGIKKINDSNDYYVSGLADSRIKSD